MMINFDQLSSQVLSEAYGDNMHLLSKSNPEIVDFPIAKAKKLLVQVVTNISMESYIAEYHLAKKEGLLCASSLEERVKQFHRIFNAKTFLTHYPVLKVILDSVVRDTVSFLVEIVTHYQRDVDEINHKMGKDFGKLTNIYLGAGDLHNGRSVSTVVFEHGSLIYKPHSLKTDVFLEAIFAFINPHIQYPMKGLKNVVRPEYGWQQLGCPKPCSSFKEVEKYYYRIGVYLGVFYLLCATDMHNENIIAQGEWPLFFDTETLVTNRINAKELDSKSILESVLNTAVLPSYQKGGFYEVNFSAVFTDDISTREVDSIELRMDPIDDFIYAKTSKKLSSDNNKVTLNGRAIEVTEVRDFLIKGFQDVLSCILKRKDSFIGLISSPEYDDMRLRQVLRPTKVYAKFISAALNPKALSSESIFNQIFDILVNKFDPGNKFAYSRLDAEINSMKQAYIPSFFTQFNDTNIYDHSGLLCEGYYQHTSKDVVVDKCEKLSEDLIRYQTKLINISLETLFKTSDIDKNMIRDAHRLISPLDKRRADSIVRDYFECIINDVSGVTPDEMSFVLLENEWDSFIYKYGTPGLYHFGGLVWFMTMYAYYYDKTAFSKVENIYKHFTSLYIGLHQTKQSINYSLYEGFGSLTYISFILFQTTGDKTYYDFSRNLAEEILTSCINNAFEGRLLDFINGASGILSLISKLEFGESLNDKFERVSNLLLVFLSEMVKDDLECGLAHGISGIVFCLANLYQKNADDRIREQIEKMMELENKLIEKKKLGASWCKGKLGIALARLEVLRCLPRCSLAYSLAYSFLNTIDLSDDMFSMGTPCLCHGTYGSFDILHTLKLRGFLKEDMTSLTTNLFIDDLTKLRWFKSTDAPLDSAMIGSSGLAYTLMRFSHPEIPSFLSLDIFQQGDVLL